MNKKEELHDISNLLDEALKRMMTPKRYGKAVLDLTALATDDLHAGARYLNYIDTLSGIYISSVCAFLATHAENCEKGECLTLVYDKYVKGLDATAQEMLKDYAKEDPKINFSILIGETTNQRTAREVQEEIVD